ncbi:MAG: HI0074 family nucleotidyltransferase substrate-binding subunit [Selenomonadaceae bacterium]|nr:HI0074 family nucleotidyltransferase substrate-binding subunit [Selenomonadaceae bacterium]
MKKYDNFLKSLENLKEGAKKEPPYTVLEETGMMALFEICFEQSWKVMKAFLELHGRIVDNIASPRAIIKTAYQCGMITDEKNWLYLLETRNLLAHTYSDEKLADVIDKIRHDFLSVFETLSDELAERWVVEC